MSKIVFWSWSKITLTPLNFYELDQIQISGNKDIGEKIPFQYTE